MTESRPALVKNSRLEVMNFLNNMTASFPAAVSFASGRPTEEFFDLPELMRGLEYYAAKSGVAEGQQAKIPLKKIAQYGSTGGLIGDAISKQLRNDEGIVCRSEDIFVTAGCQEAIDLCLTSIFANGGVLIVRNPTYVGATGLADLRGIEIAALNSSSDEGLAGELSSLIDNLVALGKTAHALYITPEFDNPTGEVLSVRSREEILAVCSQRGITILEDNPYGMFRYSGSPSPTLYSLDRAGCTLYLGTYSKTLCPSLRVGFVVLPSARFGSTAAARQLHAQLAQRKSYSTVNTSQINQAVVAGVLDREGYTLRRQTEAPRLLYAKNRDALRSALAKEFDSVRDGVTWNEPQGGFFLTVNLPFSFGHEETELCAREFGVLVMPMRFFALDDSQDMRIRLAFSNIDVAQIELGISRLASFVRSRLLAAAA